MYEDKENTKDDESTKEDDIMNTNNNQLTYDKQKFLSEFEESLKEMIQMRKNKNSHTNTSWRDLFEKKEK